MTKQKRPETEAAIADLYEGKTVKQAAKDHGVSYCLLWAHAKKLGIKGGYRQRDRRPIEVRIKEAILIHAEGHWYWKGPDPKRMTPVKALRTPRNCARWIAGMKSVSIPTRAGQSCGTPKCINPHHSEPDRNSKRNREIVRLWQESEDAKKKVLTLALLGQKFGLTRERVRQIIALAEQE